MAGMPFNEAGVSGQQGNTYTIDGPTSMTCETMRARSYRSLAERYEFDIAIMSADNSVVRSTIGDHSPAI